VRAAGGGYPSPARGGGTLKPAGWQMTKGVPGWLSWTLLLASALVGVLGAPVATVLARAFFVLVAGGAVVAALSVVGRRAQAIAAAALLVLMGAQVAAPGSVTEPPPSQWTVALSAPGQRVRHTMQLPLDSPAWDRWWVRASGAAVYVCARGPLEEADGLDLWLGDQPLARVTQAQAFGPRPQPTSVGFYRIPVTRPALERSATAVFELRRAPGSTTRPVEVCGTFTYRPTAGIESSAFFDGARWTSPGPTQRGRYIVELRIEKQPGSALVALY
jgi:hypothetical protein